MLANRDIAELLVEEAERASGSRSEALLRAAKNVFLWPEEANEVAARGDSLLSLAGIHGSLARRIRAWLDAPPPVPEPAESRREFLTLAEAKQVLRQHPAWRKKAKGDLQMHTTWSDGESTILEMTAASIERGYRYIALTDHTAGLKVANGMDMKRLQAQAREIAQVNEALRSNGMDFTVLHSVEMNLSPDGSGDMKPAALQRLDLVLGSFHSSLNARGDQTARYLAALRNPNVHILGHPQTRRWNLRTGLDADWPRVFSEAARLGKAVEVDGYAERQDLRLSLLLMAKKEGCLISLGSDAHKPIQLEYLDFALAAVCLAKIPASRILNIWEAAKLKTWARER